MAYITNYQTPILKKLTLDDLLNGKTTPDVLRDNLTNTVTHSTSSPMDKGDFTPADIDYILFQLEAFVSNNASLYEVEDRHTLYKTFKIPKKSGGLRTINAPLPALMEALRTLRNIFINDCKALYHTSAFAYMPGRSTVDAIKKHQQNSSHWFLKVDFHDFFGSTTKEFTLNTLKEIVPFNLLMADARGKALLDKALDLCFLDGGLPQGTPISPMLTNLLMIPIDHELANTLHNYKGNQYVYTRYADDMLISCLRDFNKNEVKDLIKEVMARHNAPYTFKEEKTRYGSRAGSNWNLGVMLNKDNAITVGHRNKKHFRAMLHNYVMDRLNGKFWDVSDVQSLAGILSYYEMIEREYFSELLSKFNSRYNVNIKELIKEDLSTPSV